MAGPESRLVVLLLLATPVRSLHLGQTDNGALPKDTQSRQSYYTMTEGFGPSSNGPMLIAVSLSKPADLDKLRNQQRKTTQQEIAKQQAKAEKKIQEEADQKQQEAIQKIQNEAVQQQEQQNRSSGNRPSRPSNRQNPGNRRASISLPNN